MSDNLKRNLKFAMLIEALVKEKELNYIEALTELCTELDIDIDSVKSYLTPAMKSRIEEDASRLNLLKSKRSKVFYE